MDLDLDYLHPSRLFVRYFQVELQICSAIPSLKCLYFIHVNQNWLCREIDCQKATLYPKVSTKWKCRQDLPDQSFLQVDVSWLLRLSAFKSPCLFELCCKVSGWSWNCSSRVLAVYQIKWGWKTCNYYHETDELPKPQGQPNPTQEKIS